MVNCKPNQICEFAMLLALLHSDCKLMSGVFKWNKPSMDQGIGLKCQKNEHRSMLMFEIEIASIHISIEPSNREFWNRWYKTNFTKHDTF